MPTKLRTLPFAPGVLLFGRLLLGAAFLGPVLPHNALFADTWSVSCKPSPEKRLAPELYLVRETGTELAGMARGGRAVFCGKSGHRNHLRSMAMTMSDQAPEVHRKGTRLLLRYRASSGKPSDATLASAGLRKVEDYERGSFLVVEPEVVVSTQTVDALLADEAVVYAAPDYLVSIPIDEMQAAAQAQGRAQAQAAAPTVSDPSFSQLWGLKNMGAVLAWNNIREAPKVIVAVIDTGVDYNHPDLKANMWSKNGQHGYDFYDDDADPMDEQDHGTHCAGTIAGVGNNGVGVVGVNWKTQIMAMRFLGPDGTGATSDAVKCIDWAVANGAHVLSNSWAGQDQSQELQQAVARAEKKGVLFVAAAGNTASVGNNNDAVPFFPASLPNANIITVGAIDVNNARGSFSHYGRTSVDIGAPGVGILSTVRNNKYDSYDGTSMATPHVAGAAVLVWAKTFPSPAQDPQQMAMVRDLIYANARPVAALKNFWGYTAPARVPGGVLDISFLGNSPAVEEPTPTPTPTPTPPVLTPVPDSPGQPTEPYRPVVIASASFASGEVTATVNGPIVSARISLQRPSVVSIVANTSVRNEGRLSRFATGFADEIPDKQYWPASIRNADLRADGGWVNVGSFHTLELPAGEHIIHWKVWMDYGARLKFGSGSMLIQAVPISASPVEAAQRVQQFMSTRQGMTVDRVAHESP